MSLLTPQAGYGFELFGQTFFERENKNTPFSEEDYFFYTPSLSIRPGNRSLQRSLERTLSLFKDEKEPPTGLIGLLARIQADKKRILTHLYEEGYYGGVIKITLNGQPFQTIEPNAPLSGTEAHPGSVHISVIPGLVFFFSKPRVIELPSPLPNPIGQKAISAIQENQIAHLSDVLAAQKDSVRAAQEQGYPFASIENRTITANHANRRVQVVFTLQKGQRITLGDVEVKGAETVRPEVIKQIADLPVGTIYHPNAFTQATQRLRAVNVFSRITIRFQKTEGQTSSSDKTLPVLIEVHERKRHSIGGSAYWSSIDGFSGNVFWEKRNLFGGAETLRLEGTFTRLSQNKTGHPSYGVTAKYKKPVLFSPKINFDMALFVGVDHPDSYKSRTVTLKNTLNYRLSDKTHLKTGLEVGFSRTEDALGENDYAYITSPLWWQYDGRDNTSNPSSGSKIRLSASPYHDFDKKVSYLQTGLDISTYHGFHKKNGQARLRLAGRLQAGSFLGTSLEDIPAERRFLLGGLDTIRGYTYKNVGPSLPDGALVSGRSFITLTVEPRFHVKKNWWVAFFMDTGMAYTSSVPDFSQPLKTGIGGGIRYKSPIGPLRFDVAFPLNPNSDDPNFALYFGLGQAF